jgi:virginiamycin B lyase
VVHRASAQRQGRQGRRQDAQGDEIHAADRQRPSPARPGRRQGHAWFAEFDAGKIGRLDPNTGPIIEFQLPGLQPTPYALGIDRSGKVWYSSEYMDVVGRLDPDTGKAVEYPFPHAEDSLRDVFTDDRGRMWFGSPANDKVGYFYLAEQ